MILLDTHVWVWVASEPKRVGPKVRRAIEGSLAISSISAWEIATKVTNGKLSLDRPVAEWIKAAVEQSAITAEPVSLAIAGRAGELGREGFHGDPADRIIVATAQTFGWALATKDSVIRTWASKRTDIEVVW